MISEQKLDALRKRFPNGKLDEIEDPDRRKAVNLVFKPDGRRKMPYEGVKTFFDAPYRPDAPDLEDFGGLQVAILGVPMDLGVTNRSGARLGPRAVRNVERIGPYNHALKVTPLSELSVADIGDVPFRTRYSLPDSIEDIRAYFGKIHAAGVKPVAIGGDHSISYPILQALGRNRPVGMVHIDAHCDTSGEMEKSRFHHGGPFRQAVLDGVLDPERTIQIGIRGSAEMLYEFSYVSGMTVIHAEDIDTMGIDAVTARAREVIGDGPYYLSVDIDGIDPAFTPGTGTPEIGGLTPREAQRLLRGLKGLDIIGGDVVEVAPQYDATTVTAQIGAQIAFEILCLMALAKK